MKKRVTYIAALVFISLSTFSSAFYPIDKADRTVPFSLVERAELEKLMKYSEEVETKLILEVAAPEENLRKYEKLDLSLSFFYNLLTFGLLLFVAYEALIRPKLPNLAINFIGRPPDTFLWSSVLHSIDFIVENRGVELKNIKVLSDPDDLKWGRLEDNKKYPGKPTTEHFHSIIPYLSTNEKKQYLWCSAKANTEVLNKPFKIIIEFDNPVFFFPKRLKRIYPFDFSALKGIYLGLNQKFDIHNVAQETARIREQMSKTNDRLNEIKYELVQSRLTSASTGRRRRGWSSKRLSGARGHAAGDANR